MSLSPPNITVNIVGSFPSWRPAAGLLKEVGTNLIWNIAPYNTAGWATLGPKFFHDEPGTNAGPAQIGINWATGAYTPHIGNFGAYIVCSGGHDTYYGNERYVWHLDDAAWRRYGPWGPGNPAVNLLGIGGNTQLAYDSTHNASGGTTPPFIYDDTNGELGGTTQILTPHEYDMLVWLPPSLGGVGTAGSVMYVNEMYAYASDSSERAHRWDIAAGIAAGPGLAGAAPGVGWVRACSGTAYTEVGTAAVDEVAKKVYACDSGFGTPAPVATFKVYDFSAGTGMSTVTEIAAPGNHFSIGGQVTSEVWYGPNGTDRWWVHFGRSVETNALMTAPLIRLYNLVNLSEFYDINLAQMPGAPSLVEHLGACWCPHLNVSGGGVFFVKDVSWVNNNFIYKITPPPRPGGMSLATWVGQDWVWAAESMLDSLGNPMQGDNPQAAADMCNGWYKRLRYATQARTILLNTRSDTNQKMYAYTPQGL